MPFRPETTQWHLPQQPDLCRWRCLICQQQSLSKDPAAAWEWHWRLRHDHARLEPGL